MDRSTILSTTIETAVFRCPRCGAHVEIDVSGEALQCTDAHCLYGGEKTFPIAFGKPVLIDFERSITSEKAFDKYPKTQHAQKSEPDRRDLPWPIQLFYCLLTGKGKDTARNAAKFLALIQGVSAKPTMLIVGGGTIGNGMEVLYADKELRRWSFDIYPSRNVDFVADGHAIPLPDASVDGVWIQAVLEHVLNPEQVVAEIRRVLRPGGIVYSEIPFLQPVHEGPYDFTRFTESGHRWLYRWFDCVEAGPGRGPGSTLLLAIRYTMAGVFRHRRLGTAVACLLFFWVRFFDRIIPRNYTIDAACGSYFLGQKTERPLDPHAMVAYYGGARTLRP